MRPASASAAAAAGEPSRCALRRKEREQRGEADEDRQDGPVEDEAGRPRPEIPPQGEAGAQLVEDHDARQGESCREEPACPARHAARKRQAQESAAATTGNQNSPKAATETPGKALQPIETQRPAEEGEACPAERSDRERPAPCRSRSAERPSRTVARRARAAAVTRKTGLDRCATAMPTGMIARTIAAARHSHADGAGAGLRRGREGTGHADAQDGPSFKRVRRPKKSLASDGADRDRALAAAPGPQ